MTTERTMEDCIRLLAGAFGWKCEGHTNYLAVVLPCGTPWHLVRIGDGFSLPVYAFAAYAEAELAKHEVWLTCEAGDAHCMWWEKGNNPAFMTERRTSIHECDPTDPHSTLLAKLRAMCEAVTDD